MIGYWLIPAEPDRAQLVALVTELARKYEAPTFEPHVTLSSSDDDETAARAVVERVSRNFAPLRLHTTGVEHSEKFTKTLFVQFAANTGAQQLSEAIRAESQPKSDYEFNPHLSLLYARLPAETKAKEARAIQLPTNVVFDSIAAIDFPRPINSRPDVEAWRNVARAQLTG